MKSFFFLISLIISSAIFPNIAIAQIAEDGTLSTTVTTSDNLNFEIDNGSRVGNNLFHSFREFSIPTDGVASFNNANDIVNIFSRVTGGNISNIDGIIRASGAANLFLINRAGIVFGPNASLDIGGSFFASTADSIIFSDDIIFSGTDTETPPLLTINTPIGLQLGANPGAIVNQSSSGLRVRGNTVGFIGGEITFTEGQIRAPEGRVELFAGANGIVPIIDVNGQLALEQQPSVGELRDITIQDDSQIRNEGDGGGAIQAQGRQIFILNGSRLRVRNEGDVAGGDIVIIGSEQVEISGESEERASQIRSEAIEEATAHGSNIIIETDRFLVLDGAQIRARTFGAGDGGNITFTANYIEISGISSFEGFSEIRSEAEEGTGNGGDINITTNDLLIDDGGFLATETEAQGNGGNLTIIATGDIILQGEDADGFPSFIVTESEDSATGDGGNLTIRADRLFLMDGAQFDTDTEFSGESGSIDIQASEISLTGFSSRGFASNITIEVDDSATSEARGDTITIVTDRLVLRDGADISSETEAGGDAGDINITAGEIDLSGAIESPRGQVTNINAGVNGNVAGSGGNINLNVGNLKLVDGATVRSATEGSGNSGTVNINAQNIEIRGPVSFWCALRHQRRS